MAQLILVEVEVVKKVDLKRGGANKRGNVAKGVTLFSSTNTVSDCYDIESQFMLQSVSGVW